MCYSCLPLLPAHSLWSRAPPPGSSASHVAAHQGGLKHGHPRGVPPMHQHHPHGRHHHHHQTGSDGPRRLAEGTRAPSNFFSKLLSRMGTSGTYFPHPSGPGGTAGGPPSRPSRPAGSKGSKGGSAAHPHGLVQGRGSLPPAPALSLQQGSAHPHSPGHGGGESDAETERETIADAADDGVSVREYGERTEVASVMSEDDAGGSACPSVSFSMANAGGFRGLHGQNWADGGGGGSRPSMAHSQANSRLKLYESLLSHGEPYTAVRVLSLLRDALLHAKAARSENLPPAFELLAPPPPSQGHASPPGGGPSRETGEDGGDGWGDRDRTGTRDVVRRVPGKGERGGPAGHTHRPPGHTHAGAGGGGVGKGGLPRSPLVGASASAVQVQRTWEPSVRFWDDFFEFTRVAAVHSLEWLVTTALQLIHKRHFSQCRLMLSPFPQLWPLTLLLSWPLFHGDVSARQHLLDVFWTAYREETGAGVGRAVERRGDKERNRDGEAAQLGVSRRGDRAIDQYVEVLDYHLSVSWWIAKTTHQHAQAGRPTGLPSPVPPQRRQQETKKTGGDVAAERETDGRKDNGGNTKGPPQLHAQQPLQALSLSATGSAVYELITRHSILFVLRPQLPLSPADAVLKALAELPQLSQTPFRLEHSLDSDIARSYYALRSALQLVETHAASSRGATAASQQGHTAGGGTAGILQGGSKRALIQGVMDLRGLCGSVERPPLALSLLLQLTSACLARRRHFKNSSRHAARRHESPTSTGVHGGGDEGGARGTSDTSGVLLVRPSLEPIAPTASDFVVPPALLVSLLALVRDEAERLKRVPAGSYSPAAKGRGRRLRPGAMERGPEESTLVPGRREGEEETDSWEGGREAELVRDVAHRLSLFVSELVWRCFLCLRDFSLRAVFDPSTHGGSMQQAGGGGGGLSSNSGGNFGDSSRLRGSTALGSGWVGEGEDGEISISDDSWRALEESSGVVWPSARPLQLAPLPSCSSPGGQKEGEEGGFEGVRVLPSLRSQVSAFLRECNSTAEGGAPGGREKGQTGSPAGVGGLVRRSVLLSFYCPVEEPASLDAAEFLPKILARPQVLLVRALKLNDFALARQIVRYFHLRRREERELDLAEVFGTLREMLISRGKIAETEGEERIEDRKTGEDLQQVRKGVTLMGRIAEEASLEVDGVHPVEEAESAAALSAFSAFAACVDLAVSASTCNDLSLKLIREAYTFLSPEHDRPPRLTTPPPAAGTASALQAPEDRPIETAEMSAAEEKGGDEGEGSHGQPPASFVEGRGKSGQGEGEQGSSDRESEEEAIAAAGRAVRKGVAIPAETFFANFAQRLTVLLEAKGRLSAPTSGSAADPREEGSGLASVLIDVEILPTEPGLLKSHLSRVQSQRTALVSLVQSADLVRKGHSSSSKKTLVDFLASAIKTLSSESGAALGGGDGEDPVDAEIGLRAAAVASSYAETGADKEKEKDKDGGKGGAQAGPRYLLSFLEYLTKVAELRRSAAARAKAALAGTSTGGSSSVSDKGEAELDYFAVLAETPKAMVAQVLFDMGGEGLKEALHLSDLMRVDPVEVIVNSSLRLPFKRIEGATVVLPAVSAGEGGQKKTQQQPGGDAPVPLSLSETKTGGMSLGRLAVSESGGWAEVETAAEKDQQPQQQQQQHEVGGDRRRRTKIFPFGPDLIGFLGCLETPLPGVLVGGEGKVTEVGQEEEVGVEKVEEEGEEEEKLKGKSGSPALLSVLACVERSPRVWPCVRFLEYALGESRKFPCLHRWIAERMACWEALRQALFVRGVHAGAGGDGWRFEDFKKLPKSTQKAARSAGDDAEAYLFALYRVVAEMQRQEGGERNLQKALALADAHLRLDSDLSDRLVLEVVQAQADAYAEKGDLKKGDELKEDTGTRGESGEDVLSPSECLFRLRDRRLAARQALQCYWQWDCDTAISTLSMVLLNLSLHEPERERERERLREAERSSEVRPRENEEEEEALGRSGEGEAEREVMQADGAGQRGEWERERVRGPALQLGASGSSAFDELRAQRRQVRAVLRRLTTFRKILDIPGVQWKVWQDIEREVAAVGGETEERKEKEKEKEEGAEGKKKEKDKLSLSVSSLPAESGGDSSSVSGAVETLVSLHEHDLARALSKMCGVTGPVHPLELSSFLFTFTVKGNKTEAVRALLAFPPSMCVSLALSAVEAFEEIDHGLMLSSLVLTRLRSLLHRSEVKTLLVRVAALRLLRRVSRVILPQFRPLLSRPALVVESLLMNARADLLSDFFTDFPSYRHDALIIQYSRSALALPPRPADSAAEVSGDEIAPAFPVITEKSSSTPRVRTVKSPQEIPDLAHLPGLGSGGPWCLTGDEQVDAKLRASHSFAAAPSDTLAKQILSLCWSCESPAASPSSRPPMKVNTQQQQQRSALEGGPGRASVPVGLRRNTPQHQQPQGQGAGRRGQTAASAAAAATRNAERCFQICDELSSRIPLLVARHPATRDLRRFSAAVGGPADSFLSSSPTRQREASRVPERATSKRVSGVFRRPVREQQASGESRASNRLLLDVRGCRESATDVRGKAKRLETLLRGSCPLDRFSPFNCTATTARSSSLYSRYLEAVACEKTAQKYKAGGKSVDEGESNGLSKERDGNPEEGSSDLETHNGNTRLLSSAPVVTRLIESLLDFLPEKFKAVTRVAERMRLATRQVELIPVLWQTAGLPVSLASLADSHAASRLCSLLVQADLPSLALRVSAPFEALATTHSSRIPPAPTDSPPAGHFTGAPSRQQRHKGMGGGRYEGSNSEPSGGQEGVDGDGGDQHRAGVHSFSLARVSQAPIRHRLAVAFTRVGRLEEARVQLDACVTKAPERITVNDPDAPSPGGRAGAAAQKDGVVSDGKTAEDAGVSSGSDEFLRIQMGAGGRSTGGKSRRGQQTGKAGGSQDPNSTVSVTASSPLLALENALAHPPLHDGTSLRSLHRLLTHNALHRKLHKHPTPLPPFPLPFLFPAWSSVPPPSTGVEDRSGPLSIFTKVPVPLTRTMVSLYPPIHPLPSASGSSAAACGLPSFPSAGRLAAAQAHLSEAEESTETEDGDSGDEEEENGDGCESFRLPDGSIALWDGNVFRTKKDVAGLLEMGMKGNLMGARAEAELKEVSEEMGGEEGVDPLGAGGSTGSGLGGARERDREKERGGEGGIASLRRGNEKERGRGREIGEEEEEEEKEEGKGLSGTAPAASPSRTGVGLGQGVGRAFGPGEGLSRSSSIQSLGSLASEAEKTVAKLATLGSSVGRGVTTGVVGSSAAGGLAASSDAGGVGGDVGAKSEDRSEGERDLDLEGCEEAERERERGPPPPLGELPFDLMERREEERAAKRRGMEGEHLISFTDKDNNIAVPLSFLSTPREAFLSLSGRHARHRRGRGAKRKRTPGGGGQYSSSSSALSSLFCSCSAMTALPWNRLCPLLRAAEKRDGRTAQAVGGPPCLTPSPVPALPVTIQRKFQASMEHHQRFGSPASEIGVLVRYGRLREAVVRIVSESLPEKLFVEAVARQCLALNKMDLLREAVIAVMTHQGFGSRLAPYLQALKTFLRDQSALHFLLQYLVFTHDTLNAAAVSVQLSLSAQSWDARMGHLQSALAHLTSAASAAKRASEKKPSASGAAEASNAERSSSTSSSLHAAAAGAYTMTQPSTHSHHHHGVSGGRTSTQTAGLEGSSSDAVVSGSGVVAVGAQVGGVHSGHQGPGLLSALMRVNLGDDPPFSPQTVSEAFIWRLIQAVRFQIEAIEALPQLPPALTLFESDGSRRELVERLLCEGCQSLANRIIDHFGLPRLELYVAAAAKIAWHAGSEATRARLAAERAQQRQEAEKRRERRRAKLGKRRLRQEREKEREREREGGEGLGSANAGVDSVEGEGRTLGGSGDGREGKETSDAAATAAALVASAHGGELGAGAFSAGLLAAERGERGGNAAGGGGEGSVSTPAAASAVAADRRLLAESEAGSLSDFSDDSILSDLSVHSSALSTAAVATVDKEKESGTAGLLGQPSGGAQHQGGGGSVERRTVAAETNADVPTAAASTISASPSFAGVPDSAGASVTGPLSAGGRGPRGASSAMMRGSGGGGSRRSAAAGVGSAVGGNAAGTLQGLGGGGGGQVEGVSGATASSASGAVGSSLGAAGSGPSLSAAGAASSSSSFVSPAGLQAVESFLEAVEERLSPPEFDQLVANVILVWVIEHGGDSGAAESAGRLLQRIRDESLLLEVHLSLGNRAQALEVAKKRDDLREMKRIRKLALAAGDDALAAHIATLLPIEHQ
uniref:Uncharacterized protein n=1 Tax=Chromera velia CCMP2878 TaxID=1169474 RepID=A0A0G4F5H1_9ALVE|eukprot:Cvel_15096.t1-p1 / transcript=Cvel_15096.t1 / gene=Cvel_15096 / organism=Chromera_velia_CCMP2878 / gene_product=hypothetical protein / transcript_product=hypothetical protein / location=Cvel_scaffold1101:32279-52082(+) / protein_length=4268 / sequence_SO=supercontig / SO=protein_coding / is_pseudo=false